MCAHSSVSAVAKYAGVQRPFDNPVGQLAQTQAQAVGDEGMLEHSHIPPHSKDILVDSTAFVASTALSALRVVALEEAEVFGKEPRRKQGVTGIEKQGPIAEVRAARVLHRAERIVHHRA